MIGTVLVKNFEMCIFSNSNNRFSRELCELTTCTLICNATIIHANVSAGRKMQLCKLEYNVGDDVEVEVGEEAIRIENFSTIMLYNSCVHQISSVMTMIDFWISTK